VTRPVYEPTPSRWSAALDYGSQQLFRRPAPRTGAENSYAYLDWDASGNVTSGTLTNPTSIDDYSEGFVSDPDNAGFAVDLTSGCISWTTPGEYIAIGWVLWNDTFTAGKSVAAVIDQGNSCTFASSRVGNANVCDGIIEDWRIPVATPEFSFDPPTLGFSSVRMLVYHNQGADRNLANVRLHVFQVANFVTGTFFP
jgi:hypothetical protein